MSHMPTEHSEMVVHPHEIRMSDGTQDPVYNEFEMAYVYCYDNSAQYCLALSRCVPDELAEIMVHDQKCYKTRDLTVELSSYELRVSMPPRLAEDLDGIAVYRVPLNLTSDELCNLDAALKVIFQGGCRGNYNRSI